MHRSNGWKILEANQGSLNRGYDGKSDGAENQNGRRQGGAFFKMAVNWVEQEIKKADDRVEFVIEMAVNRVEQGIKMAIDWAKQRIKMAVVRVGCEIQMAVDWVERGIKMAGDRGECGIKMAVGQL